MTREEYEALSEKIRAENEAYEAAEPVVTDYEYDRQMQELKKAEREHPEFRTGASPTQTVGAPVRRKAGVTVVHDVPMLSIEDVFTKEDVLSWVHDVRSMHPDVLFRVEQKIDGLSMSIRYERGKMVLAETRGDGYTGEDVTLNAAEIKDIVKELPRDVSPLEVRGEVYMTLADFKRTNERQELLGKKVFANPRNCAAGTLRQLDPGMTRERGLSMFIFNVQRGPDMLMSSHGEGLRFLEEAEGMKTVPGTICRSDEEIIAAIDGIGESRGELGYDIDGAVIKIDQIAYRSDFPAGAKYSAGHIAYKYPPEEKETVIRDVEVSVGMTGRLNPTAVFDPIRLCGTTVSRATLHNQDFIHDLHIGIGDTVLVYKSGEIIPKIRCSIPGKRPAGTRDFELPSLCPACGAPVFREEGSADVRCVNPECPAQLVRHLINFVGRDAMDIKGFGEELIRALVEAGYLKDVADLYDLKEKREELIARGILGREKNTDKLLGELEQSKKREPWRLVAGLAIPNVGKTSAQTLMSCFHSVDALMEASEESLQQVPDIGGITAGAIHVFFGRPENRALLERLRAHGLTFVQKEEERSSELLGLVFVVTGDVSRFRNRAELSDFVKAHGGKVTGSVSRKTTALINNDINSLSGKNKKAKDLGIPILSEDDFLSRYHLS